MTNPGRGFVSLVGAGPGAPDLLTVRAVERLRDADLVLYDGLVPPAVVALATSAECVSVARRVGPKALTQEQVCERLVSAARAGRRVVRLKSGDPFVFGRGGEETRALVDAGIPFEVVPGLSSALAAPALAGIPVTHRGLSSGFVVVSGHGPEAWEPLLDTVAPGSATVVVLMGVGRRQAIAAYLTGRGWNGATPVAVVVNASRPDQRVWMGQLATLGTDDGVETREEPGVLVIGDVVAVAVMPGDIADALAEE